MSGYWVIARGGEQDGRAFRSDEQPVPGTRWWFSPDGSLSNRPLRYGYRVLDETQTLANGRVATVIEFSNDVGPEANT